jgi:predicted HTH transcriptional regulator
MKTLDGTRKLKDEIFTVIKKNGPHTNRDLHESLTKNIDTRVIHRLTSAMVKNGELIRSTMPHRHSVFSAGKMLKNC